MTIRRLVAGAVVVVFGLVIGLAVWLGGEEEEEVLLQ